MSISQYYSLVTTRLYFGVVATSKLLVERADANLRPIEEPSMSGGQRTSYNNVIMSSFRQ
jgi:hypothetical protein